MNYKVTNSLPEIMVDDELFNSTDEVINQTIGNQVPGAIIYTPGFAAIKQKGFDGTWTEVG